MRNENLKNKLNNIPRDFDSERIWESIELPKKKKKRRGLIWFLFGTGIFGLVVFTVFHIGNSASQRALALEPSGVDQPFDLEENGVHKEEVSEMSKPTISNGEILASREQISTATRNKMAANSLLNKKNDLHYDNNTNRRNEPENEQLNTMPTDQSETVWAENDQNQVPLDKMEFSKNDNAIVIEKGISFQKNENLGGPKSNTIVSKLKYQALPLPRFVFGSIDRLDLFSKMEVKFSTIIKSNQKNHTFALSINTLYGLSNHDFVNTLNSQSRKSNEKALETIKIGFMGQALLSDFVFFSGISFTRHNTLLTNTIADYSITASLDGSPLRKDITIEYSLYNSYEYLDFIVGAGYKINVNDTWSITPSLQAGYSLHFKPNGQIFNRNDELRNLSQLEEYNDYYKWQGQANITIARQLNTNWEIGLVAYISSQKSFADNFESFHSASSKGIGISISRFIR